MKSRIVEALRERLDLSPEQITDEEILKKTKGSFLRAGIEFDFVCKDFKAAYAKLYRHQVSK